jgi:hypothetical protein
MPSGLGGDLDDLLSFILSEQAVVFGFSKQCKQLCPSWTNVKFAVKKTLGQGRIQSAKKQ